MKLFDKVKAHLNNIAFSHSVFALPFAYMGAFLAAGRIPLWRDLFWITIAMVGARSAAMAMNKLIDLKYDRLNPRCIKRPMVTGQIKTGEAVAFILLSLFVFWLAVVNLTPLCRTLWPLAVIPLVVYPYMKRFSSACHLVLGVALGMAPIGAWVAIQNEVSLVSVVLGMAVVVWIAGFDVIYACLDVDFDVEQGLHSIPVRFGVAKALWLAKLMHTLCVLGFLAVGIIMQLNFIYYLGVLMVAGVLIYQYSLVGPNDFRKVNQAYFMKNGLVGILLFVFTVFSQMQ